MCPRHAAIVLVLLFAVSCSGGDTTATDDAASAAADSTTGAASAEGPSQGTDVQRYPDVVEVDISRAGDSSFDLAVTVSSPYDTPDRYADGWRVLAPDGTELGTHMLMHDHAAEQPFTRTQTGVAIPPDVEEVTVEGRDQQYGFGGETVTVQVPHDAG